jgi:hypothetical protein
MLNSNISSNSDEKHQKNGEAREDDEIEFLKLKYEKLQYIDEKERERDKTIENKASMFIGSTSIMGAIIIGCANLVSNGSSAYSYVNMCILLFMLILIYCLGRSITYSVLTLRKRVFWNLGVDDLENTTNKKDHYKKLINSTIRIIKHNEALINSKVDSMEIAQESFVDFWIWSGVFLMNILVYHVFHVYGMGVSWNTLLRVIVTMALSGIGYLVVASMVARWKKSDVDEVNPNVDDEIRAVCLMSISRNQGSD